MGLGNLMVAGNPAAPTIQHVVQTQIVPVINAMMVALLFIIFLAAIIWTVWLVLRLAKAEDEGKRKEAKNGLIWSIIGIAGSIIVLIILTQVFNPAFFARTTPQTGVAAVNQVLNDVVAIIQVIVMLVPFVMALIVIWIASRFMLATDESKRKQAKQMLIWAIIGVLCALILVNLIAAGMAQLTEITGLPDVHL